MILETERLFLREMTLEDADTLALVLSDPESMTFYPHPFSREEVENWIKWNRDNYEKYGFGLWAVCLKESGEMIGDCGITVQQVENDLFPEIGYHLRKEFRSKGRFLPGYTEKRVRQKPVCLYPVGDYQWEPLERQ